MDFTNGAATATVDCLRVLRQQGFTCESFCGSTLDSQDEVLLEQVLAEEKCPYEARRAQIGSFEG